MLASVESTPERLVASTLILPLTRLTHFTRFLIKLWMRFINAWYSVQLAHYGGKYSVERMLALEEYTRNTSMVRVLLVTLGAPLFVVALVLGLECVPLQDPTDGWKANYGFWFRVGLLGIGVGNAAAIQIGFWLDVPPLTLKQVVTYCGVMGVGYVAIGMVTTTLWVFPIPFFMFTLWLPITLLILVSARLVVGAQGFKQILSRREQLRRFNKIGSAQTVMYVAYPACQVLFSYANRTHYELPVLLILPVIRLVLKVVFAFAAAHKEDMTPAQVVFTVDFFDSYYFATFIQTASAGPLLAVMVVDFIQTASELFELRQQTKKIFAHFHRLGSESANSHNTLLSVIRALCSNPENLCTRTQSTVKVRSCIYHKLSEEARLLLRRIESGSCTESCISLYQHNLNRFSTELIHPPPTYKSTMHWSKKLFSKLATIEPLPLTSDSVVSPTDQGTPRGAKPKGRGNIQLRYTNSSILGGALEVLFTSECLVLSEYMEAIVPIIYGAFVLAGAQRSDAKYHTDLVGVTQDELTVVVSKIFGYALMEVGSLIVFSLIKSRSSGISALYQLAFVLETQTLFVQSTLLLWILMTLPYRVMHFGTLTLLSWTIVVALIEQS
ncbi:unnamed protein product [Phytophthora fragariaefolia]|uniref:Unnamed protein product n=1 Tax=Phytophthora fragariaefolia TaxID=1490495 RepID=A0A9W6TQI9_9STRA|nr:unnamed protein product [Phytophthora fragariaefolia]